MAAYAAVVTLMQALEDYLTSYDTIFGWSVQGFCPFTRKDIQILCNEVSSMDSFLRDTSGQGYNREFISQISENRIQDAARKAVDRLDCWALQCFQDPKLTRRRIIRECPSLSEIVKEMVLVNVQLKKISDAGKARLHFKFSPFTEESFLFFPPRTKAKLLGPDEKNLLSRWRSLTAENTGPERARDHTANYIVSLMEDLKQHLEDYSNFYPEYLSSPFAVEEIQILQDTVSSIAFILRDLSRESYNRLMPQILEKRLLDAAHKAGSFIDFSFNILEKAALCLPHKRFMRKKLITKDSTFIELKKHIVSINKKLKKIHDNRKAQGLEITPSSGTTSTLSSPTTRTPNTEGKLVGLEEDFLTMLESLTGYPSQLKVLSIIGMGGIGKTAFSRKLYDSPLVAHHFYVRAWVTGSQQYQVREMLLGVLRCVANVSKEIYGRSSTEGLKEQVYKSLKGKRYLIVFDDMWDTKAWDGIKRAFPDDKNGSRILLTSRLREVAVHASQDTDTPPHCLRCLSNQESWELLSSKIFVDEPCPLELIPIGKQIAHKCQGLPLALVAVGGLLSKMNKKPDVWEEVAKSVGSLVMQEAEHCLNILAFSYNHLPDHLKACFLYMGIFPEDYEISVKKLIWLWIAEGFIRPSALKGLEEAAEDYVEDLVERSLILVRRRSSDGRIKTCCLHDLMRELCLKESRKQDFLRVINGSGQLPTETSRDDSLLRYGILRVTPDIHSLRRLSFNSSILEYIHKTSFPCTRSIICFEELSLSDPRSYLGMNLMLIY